MSGGIIVWDKNHKLIFANKEMRDNPNNKNNNSIKAELFEYCRLDTYAMYAIFNKLLLIVDT